MAGHIQDRWYKTETDPSGKEHRVRTDRHGTGMRYRARYIGPDGTEKSKSFPDRQKRLAEKWLSKTEADMGSGQYIDPTKGRRTFRQYVDKWLKERGGDPNTRASMQSQMRLHVLPVIGSRPLSSFKPEHIREWLHVLEESGVRGPYARVIYANVRAALTAAVDDGYLTKNPCMARSVRAPSIDPRRVVPWSSDRVFAVRAALPEHYRAMVDVGGGCGMRQGEIFGLAVDAVDFDNEVIHVVHQLKYSEYQLVFAPPKRGKLRDVPLSAPIARSLREHMATFPSVEVTLPWGTSNGPLVTKRLVFTQENGNAVRRPFFNDHYWKSALATAGVIPPKEAGERPTAAREHGMHALRHFFASVLLDGGESVKALSEYLGHDDPGFTLRTYTHLMPNSQARTRKAVAAVFALSA